MEVKKRGRKPKEAEQPQPKPLPQPIQPQVEVKPPTIKPEIKIIRAQPKTSNPAFVVGHGSNVTLFNTKTQKKTYTSRDHAARLMRKYPNEFKII